jgi:hypothetical protein
MLAWLTATWYEAGKRKGVKIKLIQHNGKTPDVKGRLESSPFYFIVLSGRLILLSDFTGQAGNGFMQGIQGTSKQSLLGVMLFVPAQAFNKNRLLITKMVKHIFFI